MRRGAGRRLAGVVLAGVVPAAGALGSAAVAAPPAASTTTVAASPGFSSSAPIDITSDSLDSFREQHLSIFKGNVEAIQGNVRLRTPQLDIYSAVKEAKAGAPPSAAPGAGMGGVERMEAAGPVYYVTPTETAKGDHGTYLKVPDTITLTGNVILTQDKNVLTGEKLVVEQKTGHSTLTSSARVRTIIYPQQANAGAAAAKPGAPAAKPAAVAPASAPAAKPAAAPAKKKRAT